ncbi:proton-coupled folate transporter-like [Asterias amurensis]|uniref:proton-coupled folate transporter-like n=1 Tax=Asterias amurensis TaxID=7602 RepID=UPI003AB5B68B
MSDPTETAPLLKSVETTSEWSADRIRASKRWITIEPVIFTALIAYGTIGTLRTEYIRMLVAESFGVNGTGLQPNCSVNRSNPQYKLQEEIQSQTSLSVMYLQLCSAFLNIFSAPVLSSWSDRSGRKGVLFLAALGIFVNCIMYLVVTTFSLSQYLLFIGETVQGLTGSLILIVAASLAYIADITTKKKRLFRFVIIDTTLFFAIGLSQVLMGYIVRDYGYMPPFAAVSAALAVALLYIVVPPCLIETRRCSEEESSAFANELSIMMKRIILLMRVTEGSRNIILGLLTMIGFFTTLMFQGSITIAVLLGMGSPFCWSTVTVGIYTAVTLMTCCLGLLVGGVTLPLCLKEHWILYICCFSSATAYLVTGIAPSTLFLFVGSAIGCLRTLTGPVVRAVMSKAVTEQEQGVVFAMIGVIESVAGFGSPLLLGSLFAATVETYGGSLSFYFLAGVNVIPFTFIFILHLITVRSKNQESKNVQTSQEEKAK